MYRSWPVFVGLLLCAGTLCAQTPQPAVAAPAADRARVEPSARRVAVTFNPFAALATYFAGDVELRTAPNLTVGLGASSVGIEDYNNYRAVDLKLRYYPSEHALQGFSIAGTTGISTASGIVNFQTNEKRRFTRPTIGTELSYQWLLGPTSKFVLVLGGGLKRFFGTEGSFDPINIPLLPTARVNIGFAF